MCFNVCVCVCLFTSEASDHGERLQGRDRPRGAVDLAAFVGDSQVLPQGRTLVLVDNLRGRGVFVLCV